MKTPNYHFALNDTQKQIGLFGMSGLGKTYLSNMLRATGDWFHYSVDYRIGTRYMGEHIVDNFKRVAMREPFLADLLKSDSIYIASNITFENLDPLSTYLGKPGSQALGGIEISEYKTRQAQHHVAEQAALRDVGHFVHRSRDLYRYPNFVCDFGGSVCEVVDPTNPTDDIMTALTDQVLMVWIKGSDDHTDELVARFDSAPKPMCYQAAFLETCWADYLTETGDAPDKVDPNAFIRWTYAKAMSHRQPLYAAMADWGVTINADDVRHVRDVSDLNALIADACKDRQNAN